MKLLQQKCFSVLCWCDGSITVLIVPGRYPELVVWGAKAYILPIDMPIFEGIKHVSKVSERVQDPFVKVYGTDYFQRQWSKWVKAYGRYLEERNGDICIEETKKISCPALIVHEQKNALVVQERPDYLQANIAGSVLVNWPEGKHNLHLRCADEFNSLAKDFLDKNT